MKYFQFDCDCAESNYLHEGKGDSEVNMVDPQQHSTLDLGKNRVTCVPAVIAAHPWKLRTKRWEQVQKGPRQDNDVINPSVQHYHLAPITYAYKDRFSMD